LKAPDGVKLGQDTAERIAQAFKVDVDFLLRLEAAPPVVALQAKRKPRRVK
jgi:hypothetical protein